MKAAVLHETQTPLAIETLHLDACRDDEVRVQVAASGLCHSDHHVMTGHIPVPLPVVLGHEVAGVVVEVGSRVPGVRRGDHVVTCLSQYCGHCRPCLGGASWLCMAKPARPADAPRLTMNGKPVRQMGGLGGFAEQVLVHHSAVAVMPKALPLDRAAVIGCAVITGFGAAVNTAKVRPGQAVAVVGCGGIGLNVIQGARLAGASTIVAIDKLPAKLALARRFGATHGLLADADTAAKVVELSGGGVDHAFEAIGIATAQEMAFATLGVGGTLTLIGIPPVTARLNLPGLFTSVLTEKRVQGSMMGSSAFQQDMPRLAKLYLDGRLLLDELVSCRLPLEQINDGFASMMGGEVARTVVTFDAVLAEARRSA